MLNAQFQHEYDLAALEFLQPRGHGFRMYVTPRYRYHYESQEYERYTSRLLNKILSRCDLFVDVGASYGFYTLLAAGQHPGLQVIAMEPVLETFEALRRSVQEQGFKKVILHQVAAADIDGEAQFHIAMASDNCGFSPHTAGPSLRQVSVKTTRLDTLLEKMSPCPAVVKVDVEGHELAVLRGLEKTLARFPDISLLLECNPKMLDRAGQSAEHLLKELERLGFSVFLLDEERALPYRLRLDSDWRGILNQFSYANLYCVRRDSAMNVCFFSHSSQLSGAERSLLELVDELVSDYGSLCSVVLPGEGPLRAELEKAGAAVLSANYGWWGDVPPATPGPFALQMLQPQLDELATTVLPLVADIDPDFIWTQTLVIPWGAAAAALLQKPHIWSVCEYGELDHDIRFYAPLSNLLDDILESSAFIYTCGQQLGETLFPEAGPDKWRALHRNVEVPPSVSASKPTGLFRRPGAKRLGFFATLQPSKGPEEAIRAVAQLVDRGLDVELLLAGGAEPEYRLKLEAIYCELGLWDRVHTPGFVQDRIAAMRETDIVLVCSHLEAFGRVGVEAMRLGKPIVYAASGGSLEYLTDGATGLAYKAGDPSGLANCIERLLTNPNLAANLGKQAQAAAQHLFTRNKYGGEVWRRLISLRQGCASAARMPRTLEPLVTPAHSEFLTRPRSSGTLSTPSQATEPATANVVLLRQAQPAITAPSQVPQAQTQSGLSRFIAKQKRSLAKRGKTLRSLASKAVGDFDGRSVERSPQAGGDRQNGQPVLVIGHDAFRAGAQNALLALLREWRNTRPFPFQLVLGDGGVLRSDYEALCPTLVMTDNPDPASRRKALREFVRQRPLAIYSNTVVNGLLLEELRWLGCPVLSHIHELQNAIDRWAPGEIMESTLRNSDRFIAASPQVAENLLSSHGVKRERIVIIPEFIDTSYEPPTGPAKEALRCELNITDGEILVFGCGTTDWRKGPDLFLETAHRACAANHRLRFFWIGKAANAEELHSLERQITVRGLKGRTRFLGEQPDPRAFFAQGHIFLLSSREDPFPLVALEAAHAGLPIVCYDRAGGMPDFVGQQCGSVVPFEDTQASAQAILSLANDAERRSALGQHARTKISEEHSVIRGAEKVAALISCFAAPVQPAHLHTTRKPQVTIIVPNYNHAEFLPERLRSLQRQEITDVEILLLDDASKDGSLSLLEAFARTDARARVLPNAINAGSAFKQWKQALKMARGQYVWIAESDDSAEAELLSVLTARLEADPRLALAYAQSRMIEKDGSDLGPALSWTADIDAERWRHDYESDGAEEIRRALSVKNTIPNASAVVFRNFSGIEVLVDDSMRLCADWLFWIRLCRRGRIAYSAKPLNRWRQNSSNSRTHLPGVLERREGRQVLSAAADLLTVSAEERSRWLAAFEQKCAAWYSEAKQRQAADREASSFRRFLARQKRSLHKRRRELRDLADRAAVRFAPTEHLRQARRDAEFLRSTQIVDAAWYQQKYAEKVSKYADPALHYVLRGAGRGLDPNPIFETGYYLEQNKGAVPGEANPLVHYLEAGSNQGLLPSPQFDPKLYLEANPDVAAAGVDPLVHYLQAGLKEGRKLIPSTLQSFRPDPELPAEPEQFDTRLIAFYLPQYHAIPENDAWWGKGFTEWVNVRRARPKFPGHYQPHVPHPFLGNYDLNDPEVLERQAELARRAGIYGFCFHHYWFGGKRLLEMPVERLLRTGQPDFPFCLCWANENWTRRWDGADQEILIAQDHSPEDDVRFLRALLPAFRDPRYIRVRGRPLLLIYRPTLLPDPAATFSRWRQICQAEKAGDLYLLGAQSFGFEDPRPLGLDGSVEFPPHNSCIAPVSPAEFNAPAQFDGRIFDYAQAKWNILRKRVWEYNQFRGIIPSWDNSARRRTGANIFVRSDPANYYFWLSHLVRETRARYQGDERMIFVNAWNEWAEGCHLEPDSRYGFAWLNATRRALLPARVPSQKAVAMRNTPAVAPAVSL